MSAVAISIPALVWAGVVIGGSLIAAPAKFRVPSLTSTTALEVGRAQFSWIGVSEAAMCNAIVLSIRLAWPAHWISMVIPAGIFAIERLVLIPPLTRQPSR